MEAYRKIPCQNCGADDGTVVGAHTNWGHGRGRGIKADDTMCASLCWSCHMRMDQGKDMTKIERQAMWQAAYRNTVKALVAQDLWPYDLPIPNLEQS